MQVNPYVLFGGTVAVISVASFVTNRIENGNGKRKKIYERIEKERREGEKKYISKELCEERSGNIQSQLKELKTGQETILTEVKNRNGKQ